MSINRVVISRGQETRRIPLAQFTPGVQAQGWSLDGVPAAPAAVPEVQSDPTPIPEPPTPEEPPMLPALALINNAVTGGEIEVLPTIGRVRAIGIFLNRPATGYSSLADVAALNPTGPHWEEVAAWNPTPDPDPDPV